MVEGDSVLVIILEQYFYEIKVEVQFRTHF